MDISMNEIIEVCTEKSLRRIYRGYKGTFATLAFNSMEKKVLPGLYEEGLVVGAERKNRNLSLTLSGNRQDEALMEIMDTAMRNVSAFPQAEEDAHFSITIK